MATYFVLDPKPSSVASGISSESISGIHVGNARSIMGSVVTIVTAKADVFLFSSTYTIRTFINSGYSGLRTNKAIFGFLEACSELPQISTPPIIDEELMLLELGACGHPWGQFCWNQLRSSIHGGFDLMKSASY